MGHRNIKPDLQFALTMGQTKKLRELFAFVDNRPSNTECIVMQPLRQGWDMPAIVRAKILNPRQAGKIRQIMRREFPK